MCCVLARAAQLWDPQLPKADLESQGSVLPIGGCLKVLIIGFVLVPNVPCLCNLEVLILTSEEG